MVFKSEDCHEGVDPDDIVYCNIDSCGHNWLGYHPFASYLIQENWAEFNKYFPACATLGCTPNLCDLTEWIDNLSQEIQDAYAAECEAPAPAPAPATPAPATCAENEKVVGHVCTACPQGKTRPAGDRVSGRDTFCDVVCGENEKVEYAPLPQGLSLIHI